MRKHKNMLIFVVTIAFIATVTFLLAPVNRQVAEAQTDSHAAAPVAASQQERPPFEDVDISQVGRNQEASRRPGEGLGPLTLTELKRKASDGRSWDWYGRSVAIADNVAAIGISGDDENGSSSGSVQLLQRNGNAWSEDAKLTASDGSSGDNLGFSVSVHGEVVVAGAPYKRGDNNEWGKGAAYVFVRQGSDWVEASKLTADDGEQSDYFGQSVSVSGDVAIVGAPYDRDDNNGWGKGAAYIFRSNGSSWVQEAKLIADDGDANDYFGQSVSIHGDVAIIGSYGDDDAAAGAGAAYVFRWNGSEWIQEDKLTANDGAYFDCFGYSVSISGDVAVVGAYYDDENGNASGSAYLYRYNGTEWVQEQKLTPSNGAAYDYFGYSVSITNNKVLVGGYGNDNNSSFWPRYKGAAYLYRWNKSTSQWEEGAKLQASDGANYDYFGQTVALSNDVAIAGAVGDDDNGSNSGSAYLYLIDAGPIPERMSVSPTSLWVTLRPGDTTTETVTIENLGAGDLNWSVSSDSAWLSPSPSSGTATSAIPGTPTLNIDATSLEPGEYEGRLTISGGGETITVLVWLTVSTRAGLPIVSPAYGFDNVQTLIYIQGSGFDDSTTVTLGSEELEIQYVESGLLSALVPTGLKSGFYNVTVQTGGGDPLTAPNAYEVIRSTVVNDLLSSSDWLWSEPYPLRVGFTNSGVGLLVQQLGGRASINEVTVEFRLDSPVGPLLGRGLTNVIEPFGIESTNKVIWEPEGEGEYVVCAIIDPDNEVPESNEENNSVCRTLTVLDIVPDIIPPEVENPGGGGFVISDDILTTAEITSSLDITATDNPGGTGLHSLKYIEFEYSLGAHRWVPVQRTPWITYTTAYSNYSWQLVPTFGMRYLQAWVADGAGNISLKPGVDVIDLLPSEQPGSIARNGVDFYRILLEEGDTFTATLDPVDGDPDLYLWGPNGQLWADPDGPVGIEQVIIDSAPVKGTYQIEVHGFTDGEYLLNFGATDVPSSTLASRAMPLRGDDRPLPKRPAVPLDEWPEFFDVEAAPVAVTPPTLYLPMIISPN